MSQATKIIIGTILGSAFLVSLIVLNQALV